MSTNIDGKIIVITGASSGLGEAAARHLSSLGASVVLGARRTDRVEALARELSQAGRPALALATDVTIFDEVQRLVDAAVARFRSSTSPPSRLHPRAARLRIHRHHGAYSCGQDSWRSWR
jgi:NADP-dependent 3-hydroxy acid dehydrogenase YdfG